MDPDLKPGTPSEIPEKPARQGSVPNRAPEPFGKYILLQRIGAGGMAEVFQAIVSGPEGFQRSLVIKRMLPQLSQDEAFVRMFIDEAKLSGLLAHPNLVQIFEFGKVEDSFFIAMEHVHGRTLAAIKSKLTALGHMAPIAASIEIARQICRGLHYAHSLQSPDGKPIGIVHRDISPPNIMLDFHGVVKILDFGIARVAEGLRDSRTQVGMMKGKISYMSPEQLQLEDIDHRSDIFAVGILLHELLTGQRLFRSNTDYASSRMVLELNITEPSSLNAAVPASLDRVVMRALQRDRNARYPTAGEMATDLEQVMTEMRYSPREHLKLLSELFPGEAKATEKGMTVTGTFGGDNPPPSESDKPTSFVSHSHIGSGATTAPSMKGPGSAVTSGGVGWSPRKRIVLGAAVAAIVALAAIPLAMRIRSAPAPVPVAATPATTKPLEAPAPEIRVSLDSTPQDAEVTRIDSGALLGRTPLTITLSRSTEAIAFRVEKPDHEPAIYKIIPDLDKTVRIDLAPIAKPTPAARAAQLSAAAPVTRATSTSTSTKRGTTRNTAPAVARGPAAGKDCFMTVGSFPWAQLWIDGKDSGQPTPVVHLPVTCGPHKLRFKRDNPEIDQVVNVAVTAGREFKQNFQLASADSDG